MNQGKGEWKCHVQGLGRKVQTSFLVPREGRNCRTNLFSVGLCVNLPVVGVARDGMCSRTDVAVITVLGVLEEKKDMEKYGQER